MPAMSEQAVPMELQKASKPSLLHAFEVFQRQCELLENSHRELRQRLDQAELELAAKNQELARRIAEIEGMQQRLNGILQSINDAVLLVDAQGTVEVANRAAMQLFGPQVAGSRILAELPPLAQLLNSESTVNDVDIELALADCDKVVMVSVIPMLVDKESTGKVVAIKDVTEHRRLQQCVAREDRMAALGKVAASVAHEIRNPLSAIEGFACLLQKDLRGTPPARLAEKVIYGARQVNGVVNNLLNYTRDMRCAFTPQDLNPLIEHSLELVRLVAADRQVTLDEQLASEPLICAVDSVQIKQVLGNLLSNAIEACPIRAGGRICIRSLQQGRQTILSIEDNGCGIPAEALAHIFEPFFTLKDGGIGLGLALSHRIIELHAGSISVVSREGCGTCFTVTLSSFQEPHL